MTDHGVIIKKAQDDIGEMDQETINSQDSIDVNVAFIEGGDIKLYSVRFFKEIVQSRIVWTYPKIVENS
jgi:hypothetical protein